MTNEELEVLRLTAGKILRRKFHSVANEDIEDAVSNSIEKALTGKGLDFLAKEDPIGWLVKVGANYLANSLKRRAHFPTKPLDGECLTTSDAEMNGEYNILHETYFKNLPKKLRTTVALCGLGMKPAEIAKTLGVSTEAVNKRLQRSKSKLKKLIGLERWLGKRQ